MQLLEYDEAKTLLSSYGLKSIESRYMNSSEEAVKFAMSKPIALKLISGKALHKTKLGLVKLNLATKKEIKDAFNELAKKGKEFAPYKIQAQKMADKGIETIIGGRTDPQFGKLILLGLGGIYVEIFKDVSLRICPISNVDANDMIDQLKSEPVITFGERNRKMITELLLKVSKLLTNNQDIQELDLNPIILREDSYDIVDIRILK